MYDEWHTAKRYKITADKYDNCTYKEITYRYNGLNFYACCVYMRIDSRDDIPQSLEDIGKIMSEQGVKYVQIGLNYGEFAGLEPMLCVCAPTPDPAQVTFANEEKKYFFYYNAHVQCSYSEDEFLNLSADELERIYQTYRH